MFFFAGAIKQQLSAFLDGFYDVIPKRMISIFNEQEIELLMSGLPNIDIEDLKANTEYHKYQANSLQVLLLPPPSPTLLRRHSSEIFILVRDAITDPVVLARVAIVRSRKQSGLPPVRHRNVEGSAAGLQSVGRHERNAEVPDPSRRSLHRPPALRQHMVRTCDSSLYKFRKQE